MTGEASFRIGLRVGDVTRGGQRPMGRAVLECLDPYGYAWKFFQLLPSPPPDSLTVTRDSWFA
jgi:hypothetical protein